jgi:hypothetical protein
MVSTYLTLGAFVHKKNDNRNTAQKAQNGAGRWWLTSVILATQEAEIRKIAVQSQTQANSLRDPISRTPFTKKGWWTGSR